MNQPNPNEFVGEKHWRSLVKALSWRATGTVDTIILSYLVTGHVGKALSIGALELGTKTVLYYAHERAWLKIPLGKIRRQTPEYHI